MEIPGESTPKQKTRVLIVEDQISIREMLATLIAGMPEFEVVAEAGSVDEALRLLQRTKPEVVILDWMFPGGGGPAFLRGMQTERLFSHVLVMSADTEDDAVREALTGGAKGYIEKVADLDEFMRALRTVATGGAYFGPVVASVVERLVKRLAPGKSLETTMPAVAPAAVEVARSDTPSAQVA